MVCITTGFAGVSTDIGAIVVLVTAFAFTLDGMVTCAFVDPTVSGTCVVTGADTRAGWVVSGGHKGKSICTTKA